MNPWKTISYSVAQRLKDMHLPPCIFFLLFLPLAGSGQCPPRGEIATIVGANEMTAIVQLAKELENCPDLQDSLAWVYHNLGVDHYQAGQLTEAIEATQRALSLRKKILPTGDFELGRSHRNLGSFYLQKQAFHLAEPHLKEAFRIYDELDNARAIPCIMDLANGYGAKGDYDSALSYLEIARQKSRHHQRTDYLASCYLDIGKVMNDMKAWQLAIDTLQEAARIFQSMEERSFISATNQASCYNNLAVAYDGLADYPSALQYYQKSIDTHRELENFQNVYLIHNNMGVVQRKLENFRAARAHFDQALQWATTAKDHYLQAYSFDNIGDLYLHLNEYSRAIDYYGKALQSIIPKWNEDITLREELLANVSDKQVLLTILTDRANCWRQWFDRSGDTGHLKNSLNDLTVADQILDLMRYDLQAEGSKLFWRRTGRPVYEAGLEICHLLNDPVTAYHFFEKSKAMLLLDALLAINARELIPDSVAQREIELQTAVLDARQALEATLLPEDLHTPEQRQQLIEAQQHYGDFMQFLQIHFPKYHRFRYSSDLIALEQVQQQMLNDTTNLIHYFYGEDHIFALNIGRKFLHFEKIAKTQRLDSLLAQFTATVSDNRILIREPLQYITLSHELYLALYAPCWPDQQALSAKVLIVPDGNLNFIPFEALLYEPTNGHSLAVQPYLLHKQMVNYTYSATVMHQQATISTANRTNKKVLGFAPFANRSGRYTQLDYSQKEIPRKLGACVIDRAATVQKFQQDSPGYAVIHLATHASSEGYGDKPYIAFADTNLYMPQLYNMSLNAHLVVLSACQTGLGKLQKGEGVMSLARAFSYTGTPGLIASLWEVNDAATQSIFSHFYDHLQYGASATEALHRAKLDYLNTKTLTSPWKTPYYWAGFLYIGLDQPIPLKPNSPIHFKSFLYIFIGLLLVLVLLRPFSRWVT